MADADRSKLVMHSCMTLNNNKCCMMASDSPKATEIVTRGTNVSMSLLFDDDKKVPTAFDQLSAGGTVIEALLPQFWGGLFGHLEDRYGLRWMCVGPHSSEDCSGSNNEQANKKAKHEEEL